MERVVRQGGRYVLYGAVVDVQERMYFDPKAHIKRFIDKTAFRIGYVDRIDYKNHQNRFSYNRGDHSIVVAMAQRIKEINKSARVVAVQWGELKSIKLTKADKVLVCGSGYFFPDAKGNFPRRLFSDLRAIKDSGSDLHFIGAGYNYILAWRSLDKKSLPSESAQLLRNLLDSASTVTVRDCNTKRFLSNFTGKNIKVIGDPALFIDSPDAVFSPVRVSRKPRIGVNIPFHGPQSTIWVKKNLHQFISVMKRLRQRTNCEFVYFIHYDSELLIADIIRSRWIRLEVVNAGVQELPAEYAKVDMHIGGMLHSCIIATAAGVPSIGLAYDEKHFGFFDLMGRSKYCINANMFHPDELFEKSLELLGDISNEMDRIAERKRALSIEFESVLRKVIRTPPEGVPESEEFFAK